MDQPISADAWVATELGDPAEVLTRHWPARAEGLDAHAKILEMLRTGGIRTVVGELSMSKGTSG